MTDTLLIRCAQCGANNRVPRDKAAGTLQPVCGKCKSRLAIADGSLVVTVSDATFADQVERSPLPVLVDAWAPWCGPCRMVGPIVDELATELAGKVRVAKLNVDDNPATAARFDVRSIPTLLIMVNGHEVDRIVGALPKAHIAQRLQRVLAGSAH